MDFSNWIYIYSSNMQFIHPYKEAKILKQDFRSKKSPMLITLLQYPE